MIPQLFGGENLMTITTSGPDFISFQVRDKEASARFYEETVGLKRLPATNPAAVVFSTGGTAFAVRDPFPGFDPDAAGKLGAGIGVWFHSERAAELHERLTAQGVPILQEPADGPFGLQFAFRDPDGYVVTIHSKA
jgi:predicted enzyme related to lactoylglutathione lyase